MRKIFLISIVFSVIVMNTCKQNKRAEYKISDLDSQNEISLLEWNILGPVIYKDTTITYFLDRDHISEFGETEQEFVKNPFNARLNIKSEYLLPNGSKGIYYKSSNSIIDYQEISGLKSKKLKNFKGSATYYYCNIISDIDEKVVYLLSRSTGGIKIWLNGEEIYITDERWHFEISFANHTKLKLKKGSNILVIKEVNHIADIFFEGIICKRRKIIESFEITKSLFIDNPIINDTTLKLSQNFANTLDTNLVFNILDVNKNIVAAKELKINEPTSFTIKALLPDHAYLLSLSMDGHKILQPFYVGNPDSAKVLLLRRYGHLLTKVGNQQKLEAIFFRFDNLLKHSSRSTDWYWPHKISNLLYELENAINNLNLKRSISLNTFGIQMKAYTSSLDGSIQYYLLITPDDLSISKKSPLVVIVKPYSENHHHFLISQQVADFWSLTWSKYLANKYKYIIVLPSARLYEYEDMIPFAESEIFEAIQDVNEYYNIDQDRIFLHANCSGGLRALSLAYHFPDKFAAVGLYAPVTYNSFTVEEPFELATNLNNTPVFLHYDPIDTHIPQSAYSGFIENCRDNNINIEVSSSKHSGWYYNSLITGEEAFNFFKDKKRNENPQKIKLTFRNERYHSAWWLTCYPLDKRLITKIEARFLMNKNEINITGENLYTIELRKDMIPINNHKPLIIRYNDTIVFNKITKDSIEKICLKSVKRKIVESYFAKNKVIADLFSEPFLFVADPKGINRNIDIVVDSLKEEYEGYLFSNLPLKYSNQLTLDDLCTKNLFFIGNKFNNKEVMEGLCRLPLSVNKEYIFIQNKKILSQNRTFQAIFVSPFNPEKNIVIYSSNNLTGFSHTIKYPWKNSLSELILYSN